MENKLLLNDILIDNKSNNYELKVDGIGALRGSIEQLGDIINYKLEFNDELGNATMLVNQEENIKIKKDIFSQREIADSIYNRMETILNESFETFILEHKINRVYDLVTPNMYACSTSDIKELEYQDCYYFYLYYGDKAIVCSNFTDTNTNSLCKYTRYIYIVNIEDFDKGNFYNAKDTSYSKILYSETFTNFEYEPFYYKLFPTKWEQLQVKLGRITFDMQYLDENFKNEVILKEFNSIINYLEGR